MSFSFLLRSDRARFLRDAHGSKHLVVVGGGIKETTARQLEKISFYGVVLTVVIAAVPYGTVEPWHKAVLVFAFAILGFFRVLDGLLRGKFRLAEPFLLAPLLGILALAVVQLVPSPSTGRTISLDPFETKTFILVFGCLIVCGEILLTYTNSIFRLKMLIALVVLVAVGSALFGFLRAQVLTADGGALDGYFRADQGYAQFINRNHFAVMVEMALGTLFGLLLKAELPEKVRFLGWISCGVLIYSMIAANSRGGLLSLAALAVFAVFIHAITRESGLNRGRRENPGRLWWRRLLVAAGASALVFSLIVLIVAFVGGDIVVTRIEKIGSEVETLDNSGTNRNRIWSSTVDLIRARPLLGSGFGAYEVAISEFDTSAGNYDLKQAHNDYLEILANGGIVGFLLFAAFSAFVISQFYETVRVSGTFRKACCFGAAVGIFGVLIHNFVDFGLHVLVNALIFVVLIVIATARIKNLEMIDDTSRIPRRVSI